MWTRTFEKCARGALLLVDTDVLIWFLRGRATARHALESCAAVEVSTVVYMELSARRAQQGELQALRRGPSRHTCA